ncbi:MAG TPA: aromatic aminobenezylarsenical efflux permease ArsG family transporter [Tenuifilaceae bacterium]|nr:aromatic aminobenezylarsenical efflux permease ArsG family transporter [Tenuifilaceae bacterium]HPE18110.1 aromatic aminobenezylarsenical efflux permease ArsG family transporter [Tenuifilaceae bacterium]HPJ46811.1 aromatic aminobenezylarsenical efflux permease ArsG family transporter [Tenuifilaceae bacterium]HPQ35296.1 aromatic aminobenezylarsenical efflux permease ArsG family transporter [Tenuifilaceae bacterium]HRX69068.1 aromatic aminobenezylarsenical efflux permease ArsG family transport
MDFLQNLIDTSQFPTISAFALGLMTAISPCPLATNISAIGFISKDIEKRRLVFINGLLYTLGRAVSYTVLGIILITILKQGASIYRVQKFVSIYGEMFIGPLLIVIGVFMLNLIPLNFSFSEKISRKAENKATGGDKWGTLLLGIAFALAFCPYSGVLYFGGLIPLSVSAKTGYFLPIIFAFATGLPVIIISWILAFSITSIGSFYNRIKVFEKWFRRIVALVFIGVGIYYISITFL